MDQHKSEAPQQHSIHLPFHHQPSAAAPPSYSALPEGQLVKIFCKADKTYSLAVRNNTAVMLPANSQDPAQLWIKDVSYGVRVKDNFGSPAFCLMNKAHRKTLKHGKEKGQLVILVDYRPGMADEDILWTESQDFGEGYTTLRCASDTSLNMTLFQYGGAKSSGGFFHHSDKNSIVVKEGSPIVLDTWHKQEDQLWKIFPLC
eukprot:c24271_g1_i1 orf=144-749(-)